MKIRSRRQGGVSAEGSERRRSPERITTGEMRRQRTFPQPRLPPPRSVCDLEHDLSGLVGRAIQQAVSDLRVCEVENLADGQV